MNKRLVTTLVLLVFAVLFARPLLDLIRDILGKLFGIARPEPAPGTTHTARRTRPDEEERERPVPVY